MNVPTIEMPAKLLAAAEALERREAELQATERAVVAAREALTAAHRRDVEAVAAAREAGEKDPPARHEQQAQAALEAAEREREVMAARVAQVRAEYERLAEEQRPVWRKRIEGRWAKLDQAQKGRASELAAAFNQAQELRACWLYLDAVGHDDDSERTLRKALAPAASIDVDLSEVLAAIDQLSAEAVIERIGRERRDRIAQTEATRLAQEEAVEQARQAVEAQDEREQRRRERLAAE